jgi:hypothetical protein
MASTSALEVVSVTAHDTQSTRVAGQLNVDSGRACSRALAYLYRERPGRPTNPTVNPNPFDPFATSPQSDTTFITQHQARVGALYDFLCLYLLQITKATEIREFFVFVLICCSLGTFLNSLY